MFKLYDICLIGLGPAGIGFLSSLDEEMLKKTVCFEKGNNNTICTCHTNSKCSECDSCNIVSGIGGASRFSCGKISNFPAGSGLLPFWDSKESPLVDFMNHHIDILKNELDMCKVFVSNENIRKSEALFSTNDITYKYYDVYEFQKDKYITYLSKVINEAQSQGLKINYNTEVLQIEKRDYENEKSFLITTKTNDVISKYYAKKVVIATGNIVDNSKLIQNLTNKPLQLSCELGIRITVPTNKISEIFNYHGDLKLKYKNGRTYCVSKNGYLIAYSVNNSLLLEGYVDNTTSSNLTNLAIIFKCDDQSILKNFKETYSKKYNGIPIKQRYTDYINHKMSVLDFREKYIPVQQGDVNDLFPNKINDSIHDFIDSVLKKTIGLDGKDIIVYAPELKETHYFDVNNDFQIATNIFVVGAATGKFRGILQSICSGKHCVDIMRR